MSKEETPCNCFLCRTEVVQSDAIWVKKDKLVKPAENAKGESK